MQLLRSLLKQILYESVRGDDDRKITDICCHSEKVKEGSLFVCINGYRNNGHEYVHRRWSMVQRYLLWMTAM